MTSLLAPASPNIDIYDDYSTVADQTSSDQLDPFDGQEKNNAEKSPDKGESSIPGSPRVTEETTSEDVPTLQQDLDDQKHQIVSLRSAWSKSVLDEQSWQRLLNFNFRIECLEASKIAMEIEMSWIKSSYEKLQSRCTALETTRGSTEEDISEATKPRSSKKRRFNPEADKQGSGEKRVLRSKK